MSRVRRREAHITIPMISSGSEDTEAVVPSSNIREGLGLRLVDEVNKFNIRSSCRREEFRLRDDVAMSEQNVGDCG